MAVVITFLNRTYAGIRIISIHLIFCANFGYVAPCLLHPLLLGHLCGDLLPLWFILMHYWWYH